MGNWIRITNKQKKTTIQTVFNFVVPFGTENSTGKSNVKEI